MCIFFRGRILAKRINLRIEHVKHSNCRLDFLKRVQENSQKRKEAKEKKVKVELKRQVRNQISYVPLDVSKYLLFLRNDVIMLFSRHVVIVISLFPARGPKTCSYCEDEIQQACYGSTYSIRVHRVIFTSDNIGCTILSITKAVHE